MTAATKPFSIPTSGHAIVGKETVSREWYRFFQSMFNVTGSGQINLTGTPSDITAVENLALIALNQQVAMLQGQVEQLRKRVENLEAAQGHLTWLP